VQLDEQELVERPQSGMKRKQFARADLYATVFGRYLWTQRGYHVSVSLGIEASSHRRNTRVPPFRTAA